MVGKSHKRIALNFTSIIVLLVLITNMKFIIDFNEYYLVPVLWLPLTVVGGYLPDIDKSKTIASSAYKKLNITLYCLIICLVIFNLFNRQSNFLDKFYIFMTLVMLFVLVIFLPFILTKFKHRRETHSIFFIFIIFCIDLMIFNVIIKINIVLAHICFNLGVGLILGVLSHILIDLFNDVPLHIFYPLELILQKFSESKKPVYIIPAFHLVKTSSSFEFKFIKALIYSLWIFFIIFLLVYFMKVIM